MPGAWLEYGKLTSLKYQMVMTIARWKQAAVIDYRSAFCADLPIFVVTVRGLAHSIFSPLR